MNSHRFNDLIRCNNYYSRMPGGRRIIEMLFPLNGSIKDFYYLTPSGFLVTDIQLNIDNVVIEYKGECYDRKVPTVEHFTFCDEYITIDRIERYIREYVESLAVCDDRSLIEGMLVAVQQVISFYVL